jgi:hypothetical protein
MDDLERIDQIGRAMQAAWSRVKKAQSRLWSEWMTIGEGLLEGRRWAMQQASVNRPEGRGYVTAFAEWLTKYKVDDMDKSDRAKLLQLMEERLAVEEWRATLTDHERRNLNNPLLVWRKWTAAMRVKNPRQRTAGASASEMGRARATVEEQAARIKELEEERDAIREELGRWRAKNLEAEPAPADEAKGDEKAEDWDPNNPFASFDAHLAALTELAPTAEAKVADLQWNDGDDATIATIADGRQYYVAKDRTRFTVHLVESIGVGKTMEKAKTLAQRHYAKNRN